MTADNLSRRGVSKPQECQFCLEHESIHHLLFDCVVAKYVWTLYNFFSGVHIGNYFDLASKWLCEKKISE